MVRRREARLQLEHAVVRRARAAPRSPRWCARTAWSHSAAIAAASGNAAVAAAAATPFGQLGDESSALRNERSTSGGERRAQRIQRRRRARAGRCASSGPTARRKPDEIDDHVRIAGGDPARRLAGVARQADRRRRPARMHDAGR